MKKPLVTFLIFTLALFSSRAKKTTNQEQNSLSNDAGKKKEMPNIIFFLADDMGWGDIYCNNPNSKIKTPNINQLALEGMRFTDAHCVGSLSAPSRFGLLTGRNPVNWTNYTNIQSEAWNCLTLPQMLQAQGYYTACVGKWHFGVLFEGKDGRWGAPSPINGKFPQPADNWILKSETRLGPNERGFDYFFGSPLQPGERWYVNMENRKILGNPKLDPETPSTDDFDIQKWMGVILNKSKEIICRLSKGDQPFFLYFPLNSPHKPIVPDEPFIGKSGIGKYGDYCEQVDWCLGELMQSIDEAGIRDNTILIFTSDNGSYYYPESVNASEADKNELAKNQHLANGHFKKGKGQPEEGGHRIPYIVRWPHHIEPASVNENIISLGDHFATFATITNYQLNPEDAIDSWDILSLWLGKQPDEKYLNRVFFHYNNNPQVNAVRKGKWKLIPEAYRKLKKSELNDATNKNTSHPKEILIPGQLYDLNNDPGENYNLWAQYPEIVKELTAELSNYMHKKTNASHIK